MADGCALPLADAPAFAGAHASADGRSIVSSVAASVARTVFAAANAVPALGQAHATPDRPASEPLPHGAAVAAAVPEAVAGAVAAAHRLADGTAHAATDSDWLPDHLDLGALFRADERSHGGPDEPPHGRANIVRAVRGADGHAQF